MLRRQGLGCCFPNPGRCRLGLCLRLRLLHRDGEALLPVRQPHDLIHLRERRLRRGKPLRRRTTDKGVAEHPILRHAVPVEECRAEDEHRARIALFSGLFQPPGALGLVAVAEQQEPQGRLGVDVPLRRGTFEPRLGRAEVDLYAAAEAIGLPEVELGIGIAFFRQWPPDSDGASIIGALPGFDPRLYGLG